MNCETCEYYTNGCDEKYCNRSFTEPICDHYIYYKPNDKAKVGKVNAVNIEKFKYHYDFAKYTCMMCGRSVYLDESISKRGNRLICTNCEEKISWLLGISKSEILKIIHKEIEL